MGCILGMNSNDQRLSCWISTVLCFLFIPFVCILTVFFTIYKTIITYIVKSQNGDLIPVNKNDVFFLMRNPYQQSVSVKYIRFVLVFEGPMTLEKLRQTVWNDCLQKRGSKLLLALTNKHNYWFWKKSDFNINDHVIYMDNIDLSKTLTEDELLSKYDKKVIPQEHKPLWKISFIPKYMDYSNKSANKQLWAIDCTFHHAYGDMTSIMSLFLKNPDKINKYIPVQNPTSTTNRIFNITTSIPSSIADFVYFHLTAKHCPLASKWLTHKQNVCLSRKVPLSLLKDIRRKTKCSITGILWTSIAELFCYWQAVYELDFEDLPMLFPGQRPATTERNHEQCLVNSAVMRMVSLSLLRKETDIRSKLVTIEKLYKSNKLERHIDFGTVLQTVASVIPKSLGHDKDAVLWKNSRLPLAVKAGNHIGPDGYLIFSEKIPYDYVQLLLITEGLGIAASLTTCNGHFRVCLTVDEVILKGRTEVQHLVDVWANILINMSKEIC